MTALVICGLALVVFLSGFFVGRLYPRKVIVPVEEVNELAEAIAPPPGRLQAKASLPAKRCPACRHSLAEHERTGCRLCACRAIPT